MKIFPVVHVEKVSTAIRESSVALKVGADGVFLVDHDETVRKIFGTIKGLREREDNRMSFIGVNFLKHTTEQVLDFVELLGDLDRAYIPQAIWLDDIRNSGKSSARELYEYMKSNDRLSRIMLFGGVAFKDTSGYAASPIIAGREAAKWRDCMDVVATSSPKSGVAPNISKLNAVKQGAGGKPIAVASGITPKNIVDYSGIVDHALVSSSIETFPFSGIFDKNELGAVVDAAHSV